MDSKKKIILTVLITAVTTAVISSSLTSFVKDMSVYFITSDDKHAFDKKIKVVDTMLENKYLYDYDRNELGESAVKAYIEKLEEPYTHYYTQEEFSTYIGNIQDGYVGIGIIVGVNKDNQIEVIAPLEDSPAYNAGVKPGDILKSVEGVEYSGDKLSEAVEIIKSGVEGTTVNITLIRDGKEITLDVERKDIASDSVKSEILDDGIAYLRITGFNMQSENGEHSTYSEFSDNIKELQDKGMKKLIIDLRDNPGGVLTGACDIADMLLPEGAITYTESKNGERKYYNSDAECIDIPMVVLINGNSASASEVLTGALKDYGKATVVGTKSYGKGIVQNVYPFYDGSGISITSAKYYTPKGICIHDIGIEPDIVVEMPEEYKDESISMIERSEDVQLQKAIEIIKEK
ncbi:MAG: S41 family peptidase [Clostridia bacterium]|nr:S41 family peptidase [Clostridia bacterium]